MTTEQLTRTQQAMIVSATNERTGELLTELHSRGFIITSGPERFGTFFCSTEKRGVQFRGLGKSFPAALEALAEKLK